MPLLTAWAALQLDGLLGKRLRLSLKAFHGYRWVLVPLAIALTSRVAVLALGYVGDQLVPENPVFALASSTQRGFVDRWLAWDASWYATIAVNGYEATGRNAPTVAFWPLLPLLESLGSRPILAIFPRMDAAEAVAWAGLAIVFAAFIAGCLLLYRLVLEDHSPGVARRTVTFLAFAPGAVYYTALYPTALSLLFTAGCLLALRRERWALAGLAGLGAAVAQVPGCLLVLPFAWEYLQRRHGRIGWSALWVLLIPLGPAVWLVHLWTITGQLLAPVSAAYSLWPHYPAWPWETLVADTQRILANPARHALGLVNLGSTLGTLVACVWAFRAGHASWGVWGLAVLTLYLSVPASQPLEGLLRYSLKALPTWLMLACLARHPLIEAVILATLAMLLGLLTALYVNSFWVA